MKLPLKLLVDVSGGTLRLRRWDEAKKQLSLHVINAKGDNVGVVRFAPVTFICLPTKAKVEQMEVFDPAALPADFWSRSTPSASSLHGNYWVVFVHTPDHFRHYLIAGGVRYDRS